MTLDPIDIAIIVAYLITVISLGWYLSRRAGKNLESYFLSGKSLPWYIIGISHGASGFDITGTMWFVLMLLTYGAKSALILFIWPMFAMIFRMMYLGTWIRRSNVLTGAEWMYTRFSRGPSGNLAHISVVVGAVVAVIGFLGYAFQGIGKFASVFFPWDLTVGYDPVTQTCLLRSPDVYAIIILSLTAAYLIVGGMYSVILTDLIQFFLLAVSAVAIAVVAMRATSPEQIAEIVPAGWSSITSGWEQSIDWSGKSRALGSQVARDAWSPFSIFIGLLLFKGVLVSLGGPNPGYGIQHVLATRSPKEAALENGWISVVAFFPRFLMIASIVVLALAFFLGEINSGYEAQLADNPNAKVDLEPVLPHVINQYVPAGLKGLMIAGLLAAFMSTFDSTVNAGSAYIVNDIYKRYINPDAPDKRYVYMSYACSIGVVLVGMAFGLYAESVHAATKWITAALFGGFAAPNILKWHWWRLNGYGFFGGMIAGVVAALGVAVLEFVLQVELTLLSTFFTVFSISAVATVVVCLLTRPEPDAVLEKFYRTVRPWGFWKPVHEKLAAKFPDLERNTSCVRDLTNCLVGIAWQTTLVTTPIFLVLRQYTALGISVAALVMTTVYLKFSWYDHLGSGDMYLTEDR